MKNFLVLILCISFLFGCGNSQRKRIKKTPKKPEIIKPYVSKIDTSKLSYGFKEVYLNLVKQYYSSLIEDDPLILYSSGHRLSERLNEIQIKAHQMASTLYISIYPASYKYAVIIKPPPQPVKLKKKKSIIPERRERR